MEITLEKQSATNATLKVNLKESDYRPKVAEKVKEYSKKVQLKGFRPGKVPASLVEKMYGKSILVEEINQILSDSITNYIRENKLQIIGEPLPDTQKSDNINWDTQKEFEFNYNLGLVPEFSLDLSPNVKLTKNVIKVEDKVVQETLENLRSQFGQSTNPEVSAEGDFLFGTLKEENGDFEFQSLFPTNKIRKSELSKFVGLKVDDKVTFEIENTFDDAADIAYVTGLSKEEAEKKQGIFSLTVSKINRSEPAELNQEFFDKVFGKDAVKSEEEFMAKLKSTIEENYQRESELLINHQIRKYYVDNTQIDLPADFLKQWLLVSNNGKITQEQIDKEFDLYLKELKWTLIKNKISEDNDIKAENDEIVGKTKEMVKQQFGGMAFGAELEETFDKITDNYLKQDNGKNYIRMYEQLVNEKVLEAVKTKISISDKSVDVEEFRKIAEAQD